MQPGGHRGVTAKAVSDAPCPFEDVLDEVLRFDPRRAQPLGHTEQPRPVLADEHLEASGRIPAGRLGPPPTGPRPVGFLADSTWEELDVPTAIGRNSAPGLDIR